MPWKETCPVNERKAFVRAWLSRRYTLVDLCGASQISRKTAYKWVARFQEAGWPGLEDRSRAPHGHPNATPEALVAALLKAKHQHPDWGPGLLIDWLRRREPQRPWPAASTAGEILKRHGLVKPRKKRRRAAPHTQPLRHASAAHKVWSGDFKGDFALGNGRRCYPLTLTDNYSRFLIECRGLYSTQLGPVKRCYEKAFREFGLPDAIRTDNGYPFAGLGLGGLSQLSIWLLKLGVLPERIAPGHPEQNPRHERMHRTLKAGAISPPKANLCAQQRAFNRFREEFNFERPHQGIDKHTPAELFGPAPRAFPSTIPPLHYPTEWSVRRVRSKGQIKWRGRELYLCSALAGEPVGLKPLGHGRWQIHFAQLTLAVLDETIYRIRRPA